MVILLTNKSSTFRHALFKMIFVLNSFLTHLTLDHIHDIVVQIDGEILDTVNLPPTKSTKKKLHLLRFGEVQDLNSQNRYYKANH